jgi:hypothetical protein
MWELWSYAEVPFGTVGSDAEVGRMVASGELLAQPDSCPQAAYDLMQRCWAAAAALRPCFTELYDDLLALHATVSRSGADVCHPPPESSR